MFLVVEPLCQYSRQPCSYNSILLKSKFYGSPTSVWNDVILICELSVNKWKELKKNILWGQVANHNLEFELCILLISPHIFLFLLFQIRKKGMLIVDFVLVKDVNCVLVNYVSSKCCKKIKIHIQRSTLNFTVP